jgi:hypothetical protein
LDDSDVLHPEGLSVEFAGLQESWIQEWINLNRRPGALPIVVVRVRLGYMFHMIFIV